MRRNIRWYGDLKDIDFARKAFHRHINACKSDCTDDWKELTKIEWDHFAKCILGGKGNPAKVRITTK